MSWPSTIKAALALIASGYCMLVFQHRGVIFNFQESRSRPVQVSETLDPVNVISDSEQHKGITLDDIFISVKTSDKFKLTRLSVILKTWFQLARAQAWFFTDVNSPKEQVFTDGHMVNTNCSSSHGLKDLCCKTSVEYDYFMESGKKWWCHFDDDNYVNVPRLVTILQKYDPRKDWYLGKTSKPSPVTILEKSITGTSEFQEIHSFWFGTKRITGTSEFQTIHSFWFGTFGAGVCISRSLGLKMFSIVSGGKFIGICQQIRQPDDITMGFVNEIRMKTKLTIVKEFHSHLESLKQLPVETLRDQISFSHSIVKGWWNKEYYNSVNVPGFNESVDPTRFLSLHCFLFPYFKFCPS